MKHKFQVVVYLFSNKSQIVVRTQVEHSAAPPLTSSVIC